MTLLPWFPLLQLRAAASAADGLNSTPPLSWVPNLKSVNWCYYGIEMRPVWMRTEKYFCIKIFSSSNFLSFYRKFLWTFSLLRWFYVWDTFQYDASIISNNRGIKIKQFIKRRYVDISCECRCLIVHLMLWKWWGLSSVDYFYMLRINLNTRNSTFLKNKETLAGINIYRCWNKTCKMV